MIVIVVLAIGVVCNSSSSFSQSRNELLEEGQRLNAELSKFLNGGRYADAIPVAQRLLTISEKTLAPNDPTVVMSLNVLAFLYERQGRYTDAEPLYKRSLAIREKALGPTNLDVAQSLDRLALLYNSQGRYSDAEPLYKRSLAIREKALGPAARSSTRLLYGT
jgi:tetratricopeptide (TPR) repeat protein